MAIQGLTLGDVVITYIYMYRIISKVPNQHCTSALLMCMVSYVLLAY